MNNIDLTQILKDCPKGTRFWTSTYGEVLFSSIENNLNFPLKFYVKEYNGYIFLTKHGYHDKSEKGECIVFPSKDQRNWNVWKNKQINDIKVGDYVIGKDNLVGKVIMPIEQTNRVRVQPLGKNFMYPAKKKSLIKINKYPLKYFHPFDKVIVRYNDIDIWEIALFEQYFDKSGKIIFITMCGEAKQCVPYNDDTVHLIGTTEKAPSFYINW